ncbi:3'-5' exonuclease [Lysinibacillus tabacifolii]|uniref:DNA 3'-5' helicase n=1 Tax=Lysinibacillus tabacifolii TaxID=1173107 RepID=A0ABY2SVZ3_9BACI|nr:3'-5' exonuclease [Lysinibacillus tabacifolii]TKI46244.1 DNA helicase [Lysinibacillus tabacifolii]
MSDEIKFTKEQQDAINHNGNQLLVKGIAGSGKTLVLLKSAIDLAIKNSSEKVGVFSFSKSLSAAAEAMLKKHKLKNLNITTFHQWAANAYRKTYGHHPTYANEYYLMNVAMREMKVLYPKHRFFKDDTFNKFLQEEIKWLKGRNIQSNAEYLATSRKGRGSKIRLSESDRTVIYGLYSLYEVKKDGAYDYEDTALQLIKDQHKIVDAVKYDHVIIDEAQDFNKVTMQLLVGIAQQSCRIGADIGQKIFPTTFTWKETGLDFRGNRVKTLQQSFRSTKQIIELARSIQSNDEITKDEEFTLPIVPTVSGPIPQVYVCKTQKAQDEAIIELLKTIVQSDSKGSIGVIVRNWDSATRLERKLLAKGIPFTEIGDTRKLKRDFDVAQGLHTEPGIKFTTFYTSKGLEFKYVVVVDLVNPSSSELLGEEFDWDLERRLLYVGMTRAKVALSICTYDEKAKLLSELDSNLYSKVSL